MGTPSDEFLASHPGWTEVTATPDPTVIPEHTREALDAWARTGHPVGGFLEAVLSNDLEGACNRADSANGPALLAIVTYIHNRLPAGCHGSPERYRRWST